MAKKSVLVLCDSYPFLKALSGALKPFASIVFEAGGIPAAKQLIKEEKPDLVIIDFPVDGPTEIKDLMAFIRMQSRQPRLIAIYTLDDEKVYAENLGFDAIFPKIFKVSAFLDKVKELLGE